MNEVYKHMKLDAKLDDQKVMIKDYMVNTFYGMKITCCQHLLSQDDVSTILKTSSKTSILNSHEYRCLHCLHPVNCFLPKSRQRCGIYGGAWLDWNSSDKNKTTTTTESGPRLDRCSHSSAALNVRHPSDQIIWVATSDSTMSVELFNAPQVFLKSPKSHK